MKKSVISVLTALALCLSLLPTPAMAATVSDIQEGQTDYILIADNNVINVYGTIENVYGDIENLYGTVTNLYGTVKNVMGTGRILSISGGRVEKNQGYIGSVTNDGFVKQNQGYIDSVDDGTVQTNDIHGFNERGEYGRILTVGEGGRVLQNKGSIRTNKGQVDAVAPGAEVVSNMNLVLSNEGMVVTNYREATIKYNYGYTDNLGTVERNMGGTINNAGIVTTNESGTVRNQMGGTIEDDQTGNGLWVYTVQGDNSGQLVFNPEPTSESVLQYIKTGCVITAAEGYFFAAEPAAVNASLTPTGGGYALTPTGSPVELTVSLISIDDAVAEVNDGGAISYAADLEEALDRCASSQSATVTLLKNITVAEMDVISASPQSGTVTLDLNGHKLNGGLWITPAAGSTFVIQDSGSGGSVTAERIAVNIDGEGAVELRGGAFRSTADVGVSVNQGTLHVYDGAEITGGYAGIYTWGGTIQLSGGTISGGGCAIDGIPDLQSTPARDLLEPLEAGQNLAYFDGNGKLITENTDGNLDFFLQHRTIKVGPCAHAYQYNHVADSETHQKRCSVCGLADAAEPCQYQYSNLTEAGHTRTCALCGDTAQQTHSFGSYGIDYSSDATSRIATIYRECAGCGYKKTEGMVKYPHRVTLTYGEAPTVTASSTLSNPSFSWELLRNHSPEPLGTGSSCRLPAGLSCAEPARLRLGVSWDGDDDKPYGTSIPVTVNPAPLPADKVTVDSAPLAYDGREKKPSVTVEGLTEGTDYTVAYSDNVNAGTGTVTLTGIGNYTGEVVKTFPIAKATLEALASGNLLKAVGTYGQKLSELSVQGLYAAILGAGVPVSGTWRLIGDDIPDVGDDGLYAAVFTPDEPGNFDLSTPLMYDGVPLDIEKAEHANPSPGFLRRRYGTTVTLDWSAALSDLKNPEFEKANIIPDDVPEISFDAEKRTLTFTLTDDTSRTMALVSGVLRSDNHKDIAIRFTVDLSDKITPDISAEAYTRPYNGKAVQVSELTKSAIDPETGKPVPGEWRLENPMSDEEMIEVGEYSAYLFFEPSDPETYIAMIMIPIRVTITEAPPTPPVKPADPDLPALPRPPELPEDTDTEKVKVTIETGISRVPEGLRGLPGLSTPEALTAAMALKITSVGVPSENTAVYDVELLVSHDGGKTWARAGKENFPPDGRLTVTLPYPPGTDASFRFTVAHMFTTDDFGKTPGEVEYPSVTNTAEGIRFAVTGLSPISIGWTKAAAPSGGSGGGSGGGSSGGSGGSGGGSGGGGSRSYNVTVARTEHGSVTASRSRASYGTAVTLTVTPEAGYALEALTVTDSLGGSVRLTEKGGTYSFSMPGRAVTVRAVFAPAREAACDGGAACPSRAFSDLDAGAWYHEAVDYALENGLMSGYGGGAFKPDRTLSRAQLAEILYNKEGRPAVSGGGGFRDVADGSWCGDAVAWAAARGVVSGYSDGTFRPGAAVTREQLAVMLWRYAGSPAPAERTLRFTDAGEAGGYALEALRWASERGVLSGYGDGTFRPKGSATRAQAARMLMNFFQGGLSA